jgi:hypothetical protein
MVGTRIATPWLVSVAVSIILGCAPVNPSRGYLASDEEFQEDFPPGDFEGTFLYSRFQALPEDRKDRYLSLSENDLNRELAGCIWNDELLSPKAKKLFLCSDVWPFTRFFPVLFSPGSFFS